MEKGQKNPNQNQNQQKMVKAAKVYLQEKQQQILICYFFPQIKAEIFFFLKGKEKKKKGHCAF